MDAAIDSLKFLNIPDALRRRNVQGKETWFSIRWASNLIRFFENEPAAASIEYPALVFISGEGMLDGKVTIRRDGTFAVSLDH